MIHKFKFDENAYVLDVNSGAIHVVDDIFYDILDYLDGNFFDYTKDYVVSRLKDKYSPEDIKEAYDELFELYQAGKLFSKDCYEHLATEEKLNSPIKSVCLNVAHDCNLCCFYCFASSGDFGCGRELMSLPTAKKAVDFLIEKSGTIKNLEMDFFGGEPLMNFDVVKETVKYARSLEKIHNKNFRFTLTTNGLLLNDEIIDFINEEIYDVVLSLDGRKQINDKFRVTKSGFGSYDAVVPKFQKLISQRGNKSYYVRGTYTKENLNFTDDVMHLYSLGFKSISMEPVLCDDKFSYSVDESCLETVLEEHDKLCKKLIEMKKQGHDINFFNFNIDVDKGPCVIKRLKGCGCGNDYVAIVPNGDIFACHQMVGENKFRMGNINEETFDEKSKKPFLNMSVYHKEKCKNCWAKFYCSGGCAAKNHSHCGDIMKPFDVACRMQKKKIECAVALQIAEKMMNK